MLPVFTSKEMRACDTAATTQYAIPGIILMENAARGAADVAEEVFDDVADKNIIVLCGKGNNGGDGFAIARHFVNRGASVHVFLLFPEEETKGDAKTNLDILKTMLSPSLSFSLLTEVEELEEALSEDADLVVDAMFGTGLASALPQRIVEIIDCINDFDIPILAIDIPSGIDGDTGAMQGAAVYADVTATMGGLKRGLLLGEGFVHSGEVFVVDISMPQEGFFETATRTFRLDEEDISLDLPRRPFDTHKYGMGTVFLLAGSPGMTGAAALASEAALKTGAGMVRLGIPDSLNAILEVKLTEVMTVPLAETIASTFSADGLPLIMEHVNASECSVVGPGISRNEETLQLARDVMRAATVPLVVDADALFALIGHLDILQNHKAQFVLTPHAGEFARLLGISSPEIEANRIEAARSFAQEHNVTLVLKGAPSIIAHADGMVFINATGNPGMATAGAGDVLSGIIAGLIAQGLTPEDAADCGVHLHGAAGDFACEESGEHGLVASDILHAVPHVMKALISE